jgi:hypothetical protein
MTPENAFGTPLQIESLEEYPLGPLPPDPKFQTFVQTLISSHNLLLMVEFHAADARRPPQTIFPTSNELELATVWKNI